MTSAPVAASAALLEDHEAGRCRPLARGGDGVEASYFEARLHQILRHARAHVAQAQKSNHFRHFASLLKLMLRHSTEIRCVVPRRPRRIGGQVNIAKKIGGASPVSCGVCACPYENYFLFGFIPAAFRKASKTAFKSACSNPSAMAEVCCCRAAAPMGTGTPRSFASFMLIPMSL